MTRIRRRVLAALLGPFLIAALLVVLAGPASAAVPLSDFAISSNHPASVSGQSVTLFATLTGTSVSPTGTVDFSDGVTALCSAAPLVAGVSPTSVASCTTTTLTVGVHAITASYSGDGTYSPALSTDFTPAFSQSVAAAATTTTIVPSANPSVFTQPVTVTATVAPVAPGAGTPTGTVSFQDATVDITACTAQPLSAGTATCVLSNLAVASHSLTARYAGTTSYTTSLSTPVEQVVNQASTTTAVGTNDNAAVWSQSVTFTATIAPVAPAAGAPASGTVDFKRAGTAIPGCSGQTVTSGAATCVTTGLALGPGTVTADYLGSANYLLSSSTTLNQAVAAAGTGVVLTSNHNPASSSASVTFHVVVGITAPGTATPTGDVAFFRVRTDLTREWIATVPLTAGIATTTTSSLPLGASNVSAVYRGTADFSTSNATMSQTIESDGSRTTVSTSRGSAIAGRFIAFEAAVTPSDGTGNPTGTVAFFRMRADNTRAWIGNVEITNGVARLRTNSLPVGSPSYVMSTGSVSQTITN